VSTAEELTAVLAEAASFNGSPAALLFAPSAVSNETLSRAQASADVAGIIIADGPLPSAPFSSALPHGNLAFGLDPQSTHVWNPWGNGMALSDLRKPWFSLGPADTAAFQARLAAARARGGRVGVEFRLFMKVASDAATCRRRGWCNWVGGVSLLGSLASPAELRAAPEVVAVLASADSNGIMQTRAPGGVSDMSGTVALLGAFEALGRAYGNRTAQRPAVFHWFSGEVWGYSGSKHFAEMLARPMGAPYNASSLYALLEAKQVGSKSPTAKLQTHSAPGGHSTVVEDALRQAATLQGVSVTPFAPTPPVGLPPASAHSFLLRWPATPAVVLTDHGATYENRFYQSMFDTFDNVKPQLVCDAAAVLAEAVAALQGYGTRVPVSVNCSLVTTLLQCFAQDWRCDLFREYLPAMKDAPEFPSAYSGVFQGTAVLRPQIKLLHDLVTEINTPLVVPNKTCGRNADCFEQAELYSCIRGRCVDKSNSRYWEALTPVFFNASLESDVSQPFFVESDWSDVSMRLFEQDAPSSQLLTFLTGLLLTAAVTVLSWLVARRVLL
jgi:nicastrin